MIDAERTAAIAAARGAWAIIRKGRQHMPPRTMARFTGEGTEARARAVWASLDVRQGWAVLVNPDGKVIERVVAPYLRTRW